MAAFAIPAALAAASLISSWFSSKSQSKAQKKATKEAKKQAKTPGGTGAGGGGGAQKFDIFTPQQQQFQNSILSNLSNPQSGLFASMAQNQPVFQGASDFLTNLYRGGPEATAALEAPYKRQFEEQIIPNIAERFAGVGALSSSAFNQSLGAAGAAHSENLAALRMQTQLNALPAALSFSQTPFTQQQSLVGAAFNPSYNSYFNTAQGQMPAQQSGFGGFFQNVINPAIQTGVGAYFGNLGRNLGGPATPPINPGQVIK